MAKRTAALRILFGADTKQFDKALQQSVRKMQRTAADLQAVGKNLSQSLTAPLLGIAAISVKTAADFEFAMAKVQAVSGFTAAEMKTLEKQAESLGATTSKTQDEVARLQLELAKLGKTSAEIEQMTESVLSLGIAFDQDLGETARVVGATLNQFELDASQAGRVADNMAVLFGTSALDLMKFDTAMRTVGPTANALGLSVEEVGAAMGILVNSGVEAGTVGTALTKALTTLAKRGYTGAEALTKITEGTFTVAEGFKVFGDRAGKIIPILQGSTGALQDYVTAQEEGSGAALRARQILEDTAQGGFDKLKSSASAAATAIGKKILPTVNKVVKVLTDALSAFAQLDGGVIASVVSVGTFVAAIGPAIFITGQMVFAMSQLKLAVNSATAAQIKNNLAVLANPYVAAAAAVLALAAGIYLLSRRQTSQEKVQSRLNAVQEKAENAYSAEAGQIELLRYQYRQAEGDLEKRKLLLDKMKQIVPDVLDDLDAEKTSYEDLSTAVDGYLTNLKKELAFQIGKEELTKALTEQIKLETEAAKLSDKRASLEMAAAKATAAYNAKVLESGELMAIGAKTTMINANAQLAAGQSLSRQENEKQSALTEQIAFVEGLKAKYAALTEEIESANVAATGGGGETETGRVDLDPISGKGLNLFDDYNKAIDESNRKTSTFNETLQKMIDNLNKTREPVQSTSTAIGFLGENTLTLGQQFGRVFDNLAEIGITTFHQLKKAAADYGQMVGGALGQAFIDAKEQNESLGDALKRTGKEAVGVILAQVVAMAIRNAFETAGASGPLALFLAPALAGAAAGAAKSLFSSSVPAFAEGGMVTGPQLSLLGDNPSGKEAVIPFERMGQFLSQFGGGGDNSNVNVHGRIHGRDLVLIQERGLRNQTRYR